jgi:hypothetical protein
VVAEITLRSPRLAVLARRESLAVAPGGGKWVEITAHADPLYQRLIVTAERKFWRCVASGDAKALDFNIPATILPRCR